jgi:hypothetical protein
LSGGISINRIGLVVAKEIQHREKEKDDSENDSGSSSWPPRRGFKRYGPGRTLAGNHVQGTGFFTKDSSGDGINQHATDTGGFLLSYRYHFNRWLTADATYGFARNTQQNFTSSGPLSVQANVHRAAGALVVTAPHRIFRLGP